MIERPEGERIPVPIDRFGSAYDGQWVERRARPDRLFDMMVAIITNGPGYRLGDLHTQIEQQAKILAMTFTDWNLEGDDGPLPKPWLDPGAFLAILETDYRLLMWLMDVAAAFAVKTMIGRRLDRMLATMMENEIWQTND